MRSAPTQGIDPEEAVSQLRRRLQAARPGSSATIVVSVDGPSGAGKTTFAARLLHALEPDLDVVVLHMDDIYPGWDGLEAAVGVVTRDVLEPVRRGQPAAYRRWDWSADRWGERVRLPRADVLVVEGAGSSAGSAGELADLRVWLEADARTRHRRAMERDGDAYRGHWRRWAAQEERLFGRDRTRTRADVLVDTGATPSPPP